MMTAQTDLPPELIKAWKESRLTTYRNGRNIDETFIEHGFVEVGARIAFMNAAYGPSSYRVFIEGQSSPENFERFRAVNSQVLNEITAARNHTESERERLCDDILANPDLADETKEAAMAVLCREKRTALLSLHVPKLHAALREEQLKVCKLYIGDAVPLHAKDMIEVRKETYGATMNDAFGALGFEPYKRKKGLWSYIKPLTQRHSIFIEPNAASMEEDYSDWTPDPIRYWPTISFDKTTYLGSTKKKESNRPLTFLPIFNCISATKLSGYDDTKSLEVMVRAQALWHKLTVAPFEQVVKEL